METTIINLWDFLWSEEILKYLYSIEYT